MATNLFAGIRVSDYETARPWYERLLGAEPSFLAHATEAVWELAEHRYLSPRAASNRMNWSRIPARLARRSIATPTATRSASAAQSIEKSDGRPSG